MNRNPLKPAVVLVGPREEGNIGSAARAMANMGLDELVLVRPVAEIGKIARAFAVGADHVLAAVRIETDLTAALAPYQQIVGTTSARARDQTTALLTPSELPGTLCRLAPDTSVAIVFGPEISGLNNDELARCGFLVRVPCAPVQPTLNLSQAVLIVAYEIHMARLESPETATEGLEPAAAAELEGLFEQILPVLDGIGFRRDDTFTGVIRDLRHLTARAGITSREVSILRGICRRAQRTLDRG